MEQITHSIIGRKVEGWLMYTCKECSYQLWERWDTGEINVLNDNNPGIAHAGEYIDPDYKTAMMRVN